MNARLSYGWMMAWGATSIGVPLVRRWGTPFGATGDASAFAWIPWIGIVLLGVWLLLTIPLLISAVPLSMKGPPADRQRLRIWLGLVSVFAAIQMVSAGADRLGIWLLAAVVLTVLPAVWLRSNGPNGRENPGRRGRL